MHPVPDRAIPAMDDHRRPVIFSNITGPVDSLGLLFVDRGDPLISCTLDCPTILVWHHMLIVRSPATTGDIPYQDPDDLFEQIAPEFAFSYISHHLNSAIKVP